MSVVQGPHERLVRVIQVPLLDARVPRSREQGIPAEREILQPVVVRRLRVKGGRDHAAFPVRHLEHLDIVVLGARYHIVAVRVDAGPGLEAHDSRLVPARQLPHRVELPQVPDAHLVRGRREEVHAGLGEGDVVDEGLSRRQRERTVRRGQLDGAVGRQPRRAQRLDAARVGTDPQVPHFNKGRRDGEGEPVELRVLDDVDVVRVARETLDLLLPADVPHLHRPVFGCAE